MKYFKLYLVFVLAAMCNFSSIANAAEFDLRINVINLASTA